MPRLAYVSRATLVDHLSFSFRDAALGDNAACYTQQKYAACCVDLSRRIGGASASVDAPMSKEIEAWAIWFASINRARHSRQHQADKPFTAPAFACSPRSCGLFDCRCSCCVLSCHCRVAQLLRCVERASMSRAHAGARHRRRASVFRSPRGRRTASEIARAAIDMNTSPYFTLLVCHRRSRADAIIPPAAGALLDDD